MEPSRPCRWHLVFLAKSSYVWPFGLPHDISDKSFWTKPWLLLHAKRSLYSPACRACVVSVFMEADFAHWQVGGKCANHLPMLPAAHFPTRAGKGRSQSKILVTVYLLVSSWAMPFNAHLLSKYKIVTI